jgi:hypothetical protein
MTNHKTVEVWISYFLWSDVYSSCLVSSNLDKGDVLSVWCSVVKTYWVYVLHINIHRKIAVYLLVAYTIYTKMDLQKVELGGMDWIGLAQDKDRWRAFVKAVVKCIKVFRSGHFYVSLNLVIVPNKCTISNC